MSDLLLINKKKKESDGFCFSNGPPSENERKYTWIFLECSKAVEHKSDGETNNSWHARNCSQRLGKETDRTGNLSKNQDYADHRSVKIHLDI